MNESFRIWGANNNVTIVENGREYSLPPEGLDGLEISINGNNKSI